MSISTIDIILIAVYGWHNKLHGRIRLHKTIYLAQKIMGVHEIKFRPYYYGPYSDELSSALTASENLGLLNAERTILEHSYDGQNDIIEYVYSFSRDGENYFAHFKEKETKEFKKWQTGIQPVVSEFKDSGFKTSGEMAMAAKIIFLLSQEEEVLSVLELKSKAEKYRWQVDDSLFTAGLNHLENLKLATKVS